MFGFDPLLSAIIVTGVTCGLGYWYGRGSKHQLIGDVIESTIDKLIADGYLRYRYNEEGEMEMLKWNEIDG